MSLIKYKDEQSPWHCGELTWPGINGIPSIEPPRDVTDSFVFVHYFKSKLFNLSDPKDKEYYDWVQDRIINGWFLAVRCEVKFEDDGKILAYLEWVQRYVKPVPKAEQIIEERPNSDKLLHPFVPNVFM